MGRYIFFVTKTCFLCCSVKRHELTAIFRKIRQVWWFVINSVKCSWLHIINYISLPSINLLWTEYLRFSWWHKRAWRSPSEQSSRSTTFTNGEKILLPRLWRRLIPLQGVRLRFSSDSNVCKFYVGDKSLLRFECQCCKTDHFISWTNLTYNQATQDCPLTIFMCQSRSMTSWRRMTFICNISPFSSYLRFSSHYLQCVIKGKLRG